MAVYTLNQYPRVWDKRIKQLRRASQKSEKEAAELLKLMAKRNAPYKTGKTREGIRVRKIKEHYTVESWVPGKFKQNLFANRTAPFRTVKYPKGAWLPPNKSFSGRWTQIAPAGTVAVYGQSPNWRWTGQPRFFHFATLRTRERFPKIVLRNTKKALRVSI